MNLAHVLADLGSTYNSIDVRTAAYRIEGTWYNLITVIRFSELDEGPLDENINAGWQRLKSVTHERLRIEHRTFRFDDRDRLFQVFARGVAEFGDLKVELGRPVELLSDMGYIQPRAFGDPLCHWPALEIQANTSQWLVDQHTTQTIRSADSSDDDLRRYLSTRGYASLGDAVAAFLGLSKSNHTSFTSAVYTWAPILAAVKEARWNPAGTLTITYEAHPAVKNQFWVSAKVPLPQQSDQHELSVSQPVQGRTEWQMEVETEAVLDEDARVDATLVHQALGIITNSAWFVRDLIPKNNVNPLWPLLKRFCSAEEFLRLLATPGVAQDSENRPQRLFELRVSWFLGAFGFTTFVLGPHEYLRDPGTRLERGSLDLIAFHEVKRVLVLGSCKTNAPKESDYDNLVNMRRLLIDDLEGAESFEIYMVVFTAAAEARLYKELETSGSGLFPRIIPVFDAQRLKAGIEALQQKQFDWIFDQLTGTARVPRLSLGSVGF
jgi:hypothetical protein